MLRRSGLALLIFVGAFGSSLGKAHAAISPTRAGYVDVTVAPYNADPTGKRDATQAIQKACDDAVAQVRPVYLPAGVYRISDEIKIDKAPHKTREENGLTLRGPSSGRGRAVLRLAAGSFKDARNPRPMMGVYYDKVSAADRFCMAIQHLDFEIEPDNAGAAGLAWGGAEAGIIFDVHVRGASGYRGFKYGFWTTLASGGSMAGTSVDGGDYGYYLDKFSTMPAGSRETASLTHITSSNAKVAALFTKTEWACVITGGKFVMNAGVPVIQHPGGSTGHQWSLSGAPLLIDSAVQWKTPGPNNILMRFHAAPMPFYLKNVYLRNGAAVLQKPDAIRLANTGWQRCAELAYDPKNRGPILGFDIQTGIFFNGKKWPQKVYAQWKKEAPPANLQSQHGWGKSFPDINSAGAVLLSDFASHKKGDDWQPVFEYLIKQRKAPVIIVPKGRYTLRAPVEMDKNTAIMGTIQWFTQLWGVDDERRFGGVQNAPAQALPIVRTPADKTAKPILADLRVLYAIDKNHPRPLALYPVWWRAGADSVIRNVYAQDETDGAYWIHQTADILAREDGPLGIRLRVLTSPLSIEGFRFSSDNHTKYHGGIEIPDQLFLETIGGNRRLVAPSVWPYADDSPQTHVFNGANILIDKNGAPFSLEKLTLFNTSPDDRRGDVVSIQRFDAQNQPREKTTISLRNKNRATPTSVILNWKNCEKIVLTSATQFSVDDVVLDEQTHSFENVDGVIPVVDKHYDSWNPAGVWRDMGFSPQFHPNFRISGGVKWYNHAVHGGQAGLNYRVPHTLIENNAAPVRIYHFHAQHGDNDAHLMLKNASNVMLYGMKTETSTSFIRCYNSRDLGFFGMGGATNPVKGHSTFHFDNCQNFTVAGAFDVIYNEKKMIWGGESRPWGNSHQNASNIYRDYNIIEEVRSGQLFAPPVGQRPVLYQRNVSTR